MSSKSNSSFQCVKCQWSSLRWVGRCGGCGTWGSIEEITLNDTPEPAALSLKPIAPTSLAQPITKISAKSARARTTGVSELDRVLGGGMVPGAVVILAGEPGVGKSTLLLEVAAQAALQSQPDAENTVLYVSGEESASQVKIRAERIGALADNLYLASETLLGKIVGQVEALSPALIVVDSVQTICDPNASGSPGGNTQVRALTSALVRLAKERNMPIIIVGHVTKDGTVAGPRLLEHLVDVVLQFEGDKHSRLRLLRAIKNRYGPTDEVGCFDMSEEGIVGLADPSGIFIAGTNTQVPGTCVTITLDGRRALPTQVQALTVASALPSPRRSTVGIDNGRTSMTLAVVQARLGIPLGGKDIYVSTIGGAKVSEPAVDLAVALSVASACHDKPVNGRAVAIGEIDITGEIRPVTGIARRLAEAERLGFTRAIIPVNTIENVTSKTIEIVPAPDIRQAIKIALL